jgi:hypothetical protein
LAVLWCQFIHFLRKYPTDDDLESQWNRSAKTCREWIWFYVKKIRALKHQKIVWPTEWEEESNDIWVMSVDGAHCWIDEPRHEESSRDKNLLARVRKAGMNYELGVAINDSKLVWMNGPFKAGANDMKLFCEAGLKGATSLFSISLQHNIIPNGSFFSF